MTSPVPYESRVRPLIAAATPAPWEARGRYAEPAVRGPSGESVIDIGDDGACSDPDCCGGPSYRVEISDANARLIVTAVSTAAASADLAEAVRSVVNEAGQEIVFEGARCVVVSPEAIDALRAALSRLDAAGGA